MRNCERSKLSSSNAREEAGIVEVGPENLLECGIGCIGDPKHPGYSPKVEWLGKRFSEGLRMLHCRDSAGHALGFLEFVPGENAWRAVEAKGWTFIHCLWVFSRGQKIGGLGGRLVEAAIEAARRSGSRGVATLAADGGWMAGSRIYLKHGFEKIAEAGRFSLLIRRLRKGSEPRLLDAGANAARYEGLHLVYAPQCPMLPKSVADLSRTAVELGVKLNITRLDTAAEAQAAPSHYGVFSLVWNGRLLQDHYVSAARFRNILRKELRVAPHPGNPT